MTRRRRILGVVGVAGLAFALPYAVWHPRRLNHAGFERIQNGMTQQEVEHLLGGPPGMYYPTYPGAGQMMTNEGYNVPDAAETLTLWFDDKKRYEVCFDDRGKVVGKHERLEWTATAFTCPLSAMLCGVKEPTSLEPKRFTRPPAPAR